MSLVVTLSLWQVVGVCRTKVVGVYRTPYGVPLNHTFPRVLQCPSNPVRPRLRPDLGSGTRGLVRRRSETARVGAPSTDDPDTGVPTVGTRPHGPVRRQPGLRETAHDRDRVLTRRLDPESRV